METDATLRAHPHRRGLKGAFVTCVLLTLAGCGGDTAQKAQQQSGPAAAVVRLAAHLRSNDLHAFARDAVPPAHFKALESAWRDGSSRWPLTELPLDDQLEPMLAALAAPDAAGELENSFDRNLANQGRGLRQAARSLGAFGVQYVQREGDYSAQQRDHYVQVINALSEWARQAPLADPVRARDTISHLTAAVRESGLAGGEALREAGMIRSLVRLEPFFAAFKQALGRYGLSLDRSLDGLRVELLQERDDIAQVRIRYPLGEHEIDSVLDLRRHDGRWYLAAYLEQGEQVLRAHRETARQEQAPATIELPVAGERSPPSSPAPAQ